MLFELLVEKEISIFEETLYVNDNASAQQREVRESKKQKIWIIEIKNIYPVFDGGVKIKSL